MTETRVNTFKVSTQILNLCGSATLRTVASPGFVVRRAKAVNLVVSIYGELQGRLQQLLDD